MKAELLTENRWQRRGREYRGSEGGQYGTIQKKATFTYFRKTFSYLKNWQWNRTCLFSNGYHLSNGIKLVKECPHLPLWQIQSSFTQFKLWTLWHGRCLMGALVTPWLSLVVYGCLFCFADGRCITLDGWSAWYLLRGDVVLINCHSKESWDSCWIHHPSSWRKDSSRVRVSIAQLLQFISDSVGRVHWCWCYHGNCRRRAEDVDVILKVFMMLSFFF